MDALVAGDQRVGIARRVVGGDAGARLHLAVGDALVAEGLLDHEVGRGERRRDRGGVAELLVERDVVGRARPRSARRRDAFAHVGRRPAAPRSRPRPLRRRRARRAGSPPPPWPPLRPDSARGPARAGAAARRAPAASPARSADLDVDRAGRIGALQRALQAVGDVVGAGQHREHARHAARRGGVDALDRGVRVRRAHEHRDRPGPAAKCRRNSGPRRARGAGPRSAASAGRYRGRPSALRLAVHSLAPSHSRGGEPSQAACALPMRIRWKHRRTLYNSRQRRTPMNVVDKPATQPELATPADFDRFRLRRFIESLGRTANSRRATSRSISPTSPRCSKATRRRCCSAPPGRRRQELVGNVMGSRARLAARLRRRRRTSCWPKSSAGCATSRRSSRSRAPRRRARRWC